MTSWKSNIKKHISSKHQHDVIYPCAQCEYTASNQENLQKHIKIKHLGIRHYCDLCGYSASTTGHLNIYKESKYSGILYPCDLCNYTGARISDLSAHAKRMHSKTWLVNFINTLQFLILLHVCMKVRKDFMEQLQQGFSDYTPMKWQIKKIGKKID